MVTIHSMIPKGSALLVRSGLIAIMKAALQASPEAALPTRVPSLPPRGSGRPTRHSTFLAAMTNTFSTPDLNPSPAKLLLPEYQHRHIFYTGMADGVSLGRLSGLYDFFVRNGIVPDGQLVSGMPRTEWVSDTQGIRCTRIVAAKSFHWTSITGPHAASLTYPQ